MEKEIALACAGLTLVSVPAITACTQSVSQAARALRVAVLQHYMNGLGEAAAPHGPAAFQADKKVDTDMCFSLIHLRMLHWGYNDSLVMVGSFLRSCQQLLIALTNLGTCEK